MFIFVIIIIYEVLFRKLKIVCVRGVTRTTLGRLVSYLHTGAVNIHLTMKMATNTPVPIVTFPPTSNFTSTSYYNFSQPIIGTSQAFETSPNHEYQHTLTIAP